MVPNLFGSPRGGPEAENSKPINGIQDIPPPAPSQPNDKAVIIERLNKLESSIKALTLLLKENNQDSLVRISNLNQFELNEVLNEYRSLTKVVSIFSDRIAELRVVIVQNLRTKVREDQNEST